MPWVFLVLGVITAVASGMSEFKAKGEGAVFVVALMVVARALLPVTLFVLAALTWLWSKT